MKHSSCDVRPRNYARSGPLQYSRTFVGCCTAQLGVAQHFQSRSLPLIPTRCDMSCLSRTWRPIQCLPRHTHHLPRSLSKLSHASCSLLTPISVSHGPCGAPWLTLNQVCRLGHSEQALCSSYAAHFDATQLFWDTIRLCSPSDHH